MKDKKKRTFFNTSYPIKNSSVNKITLHQRLFLTEDNDEDSKFIQNNIKNKKRFSLRRVFQAPKHFYSGQKIWPKITHPKLPFSKKLEESKISKKIKIKLTKPSKALHEFNTIKWLRNKYSDSVIEKSIHSILPKKNNPLKYQNEKELHKRFRKMLEYLESFKGPIGREKYIDINPKYLFDETTFKNILKLKEIFLEFDISGNQKMEFDEILRMFNQNHIKAGKNDILNLFFKNTQIKKKKDIMKLHLGFYQFINFTLKKEQNFRNFMRKIKSKNKKKDKDEFGNENKERIYLPMNFNLVLDYFIKKEKEKHIIKKLKKAFDELDNDIKKEDEKNDNYIDKNKLYDIINNISTNKKNINYNKLKKSSKNINKEDDILCDVNIIDLFDEFILLFYLCCKNGEEEDEEKNFNFIENELKCSATYKIRNKTEPQKTLTEIDNTILSNNIYNLNKIKVNNRNKKPEFEKKKFQSESIKTKNNIKDDNFLILIKNQMNRNFVNRINMENFQKYHDVNIAKDETLKQIKKEIELDKIYRNKKERKSLKIINTDSILRNGKTINLFPINIKKKFN